MKQNRKEIEDFWRAVVGIENDEICRLLVGKSYFYTLERGEYILQQNEKVTELPMLYSGVVKCFRYDQREEEFIRNFYYRKGEMMILLHELMKDGKSEFHLMALTKCRILSVQSDFMQQLVELYPTILHGYMRLMAEREAEMNDRLQIMRYAKAADRVKWFYDKYAELARRVMKKDIAAFLMLKPETFSRSRNELRRQKEQKL